MKKHTIRNSFIFLILCVILLSFLSEAIAEPVNIPDPGLRRALEALLGKKPGDVITQADMESEHLFLLAADGRNISDLTGIEYATNTKYIYLQHNAISDISPLSNLTGLEHLHLEHNQISGLSSLSNLTALQSLDISYNNLTSLDGLPDLSSTYALSFQYNQITSLSPLVSHTEFNGNRLYRFVNLEGNPLDDDSVNLHIPTLSIDRDIAVTFTSVFVKKISGDNQTATPNTKLQPFVVEVVNHNNNILSEVEVIFRLKSGSGNFANGSNKNGEILETTTNADGKASATLTTGSTTGTYRISVTAIIVHSRYIATVSAEPFTLTVIETTVAQPTLKQTSQQQREPASQKQPEPPTQQEEQPSQQQESPQQQESSLDESDTDTQQQEQEPTQQQEGQQQESSLDESDTDTQQQEQEPTQQQEGQQQQESSLDESDTDTQQQEPPPQQEEQPSQQQESPQQQEQQQTEQPEPNPQPVSKPEPEPNYTIIPFDYEKEGVGKVVFSELMFAQLNRYPQWIELYNTTDQDIEMKGWKIVGRYLDDKNSINILESHVISKSFIIDGKETGLIVSFATPNSRDRITRGLVDKTYALESNPKNLWNYEGLVLELQDAEGNSIDRLGNLNEEDEIVWEIPSVVREQRISLIRRLKSIRSQEYNFSFGITEFGWFPADKVKRLIENRIQYYYGRYTDIGSPGYRTEDDEPLPVTLSLFSPQLTKNGQVILSWITESEIENAGFNILRSQSKQGPFVRVNPKLIQGAGTTGERSTYTWTDTTAIPNILYYYQIGDVSFAGVHQTLTTTRLKGLISAKNRFITQWGQLKGKRKLSIF